MSLEMFKNLNEIVCIDHFYLDELILIHFMDSTTPISMATVVNNNGLSKLLQAFETG